jgi:tRNA-dihydrouridine synthase B
VFGNGDVFDGEDCRRMLDVTGCDGVAIGRMAVARPWLMAQLCGLVAPDETIFRQTATDLLALMQTHFDDRRALRRYKKFALYFSANFKFAHSFYTRINNAPDLSAVQRILDDFFRQPPAIVKRPNMNFFI